MKAQRDDPDNEFKYWETLTMPIYHLDDEPMGVKDFMIKHITSYYPGTWELYAQDWEANKWMVSVDERSNSFDYFLKSFGELEVPVYNEKNGYNYRQGDSYHSRKMTINELFLKMKNNGKEKKNELTFVGNQPIPDEIMADLQEPLVTT